ncbi:MAG: hypothetical protein AB2A00_19345 [Myxococcota bacterium]
MTEPGDRRSRDQGTFRPAPMVRNSVPAGAARAPVVSSHATLRPGPSFSAVAPGVDVSTLAIVGADAGQRFVELRDSRAQAVRLRQAGPSNQPHFTLELVGVKTRQAGNIPVTLEMGQELAPVLREAAVKLVGDARRTTWLTVASEILTALSQAADVTLAPLPTEKESHAPKVNAAESTTTYGSANSSWKGFSAQKPAVQVGAPAPASSEEGGTALVEELAPGLDVHGLVVKTFNAVKGTVRVTDERDNVLEVRQTKFSPPPQFAAEYFPAEGVGARKPVNAALAKELAPLLVGALNQTRDANEAMGKAVIVLANALLKVP